MWIRHAQHTHSSNPDRTPSAMTSVSHSLLISFFRNLVGFCNFVFYSKFVRFIASPAGGYHDARATYISYDVSLIFLTSNPPRSWAKLSSFCFFSPSHYLLSSPLLPLLPPSFRSRNSDPDPGSHCRLFPPLPATVRTRLVFLSQEGAQHCFPSSTHHVELCP